MFQQPHGHAIVGAVLLAFSIIAAFAVWRGRRDPGSPRWPLLLFLLAIALRGVDLWRQSSQGSPTGLFTLSNLSTALLWFSAGAVLTQWFHERNPSERQARR